MRRKRRAARRRPPSGGPQFNVKTLGRHGISRGKFVASSYRTLVKWNIAFTVRESRASQSHPETLKSHCSFRGVDQSTKLRFASLLLANTNQFTASPAGVECLCRAQSANVSAWNTSARVVLARGTRINIALESWERSRRQRLHFVALLINSPVAESLAPQAGSIHASRDALAVFW